MAGEEEKEIIDRLLCPNRVESPPTSSYRSQPHCMMDICNFVPPFAQFDSSRLHFSNLALETVNIGYGSVVLLWNDTNAAWSQCSISDAISFRERLALCSGSVSLLCRSFFCLLSLPLPFTSYDQLRDPLPGYFCSTHSRHQMSYNRKALSYLLFGSKARQ